MGTKEDGEGQRKEDLNMDFTERQIAHILGALRLSQGKEGHAKSTRQVEPTSRWRRYPRPPPLQGRGLISERRRHSTGRRRNYKGTTPSPTD